MRIKSTLLLLVLLTYSLLFAAGGRHTQSTGNDAEATQTAVVEAANESEEAEDFVAEESADEEVATDDSEAAITETEADAEGKDEAQPAKIEISSSEEISETDELIIDQPTEGEEAESIPAEQAADEAVPEDEEQAEEMIQPSDTVTTTESAVEESNDETQPTDPEILVTVHDDADLGTILVDAGGMTLYVFDKDEAGKSNCTGGCLEKWPPLYVDNEDEVLASNDITGEVGTIEAGDGMFQVTIDNQPLYYYAEDAAPGDINGQGVNDAWWVVSVEGKTVTGE